MRERECVYVRVCVRAHVSPRPRQSQDRTACGQVVTLTMKAVGEPVLVAVTGCDTVAVIKPVVDNWVQFRHVDQHTAVSTLL